MSTTPQFEIPVDMRKMTEQTLEQVRAAIHSYLQFFPRAVPGDVMGGSQLTDKILGYAERNVTSAFEFAQELVQVRDIQALISLQTEFFQAQMQAMRASERLGRDRHQGADGEGNNSDKGWLIILISDDGVRSDTPREHLN